MLSLLTEERRIRIRRVALHAVVRHIHRIRNRVAPERRRVDRKVANRATRRVEDGQRERAAVAVVARVRREVLPPWLCVGRIYERSSSFQKWVEL